MDVFLEKFRGGGVISDSKNYIADFVGFKAVYFGEKKRKIISKKGQGGGGSRPFGSFPKKHPFLSRQSSLSNSAHNLHRSKLCNETATFTNYKNTVRAV